ncbi:CPBP family intramembrane glutamic endopeptidase [Actinomadura livida]|uniref:Membrane protease YdiL (CAAX protease family) n=1 Tax=Actinomadura livida TaxID=79909 RepID=A0A7W7IAC4_9ACTN|nr:MULTISPECIES: CPBP family intramembrane glutamic endopeptidase [Actinomadura]MBB4773454.1 membrane protease YdiL (CAAX protease family) [Actinomadura catellatispora]GGU08356.1 hypothetical protein GCM10010208_35930 [Actinomadura livida]
MSEPGEADGWTPLDPGMSGERPADPRPQEERPPAPGSPDPGQAQPYTAGTPYWPGAPAQPPGWDPTYGQPARDPYWQGAYGQAPYPQGYPGYGMQPVKTSWTVEAPAGSPFHHLARNDAHRWWRPLAGSLTILVIGIGLVMGLMIVGTVIAWAVTGEPPDTTGTNATVFENDTADLAINLAMLAVFLPVAFFAAWGIQRRAPGTLSSVAGRLRWKWLLVCCGLAVGFCIVAFGTSLVAEMAMDDPSGGDEEWVGWGQFLVPAVVILLLVPFQAAAEEYVFRGWMLQAVGACTLENAKRKVGRALSVVFRTPWPGIVVGSALFTAGHGYTGWGILDIFAFGAIAAWVTVRTGGLEAAIALHVFNNLLAFMFSAAVGELDIVQGDVPWEVVVADIVPMVLFAAVAVRLARRLRVQTVSSAPAEDDAPVTAGVSPAHVA